MGLLILTIFIFVMFYFIRNKSNNIGYFSENKTRPMTQDEKYNHDKVEKQKEVDRLLDKINKTGYRSLTKKEIDFLGGNK